MANHQFSCDVQPHYAPEQSSPKDSVYSFTYTVTLTNTGTVAAQLVSRHWVIVDANGHCEEVKGLGVVGQQPLLRPGESFQYTSGSRLRTATGTMHGSYFCVAQDGEKFDVPIAMFVLQSGDSDSGGESPARVLH